MSDVSFVLPYPPSGNHAWKHTKGGRHYITREAQSYFEHVIHIARTSGADLMIGERMHVRCEIFPPDNRRRDLDNAWKVISDACTKAGIWEDDYLIDRLTLERRKPSENCSGLVFITIHKVLRN